MPNATGYITCWRKQMGNRAQQFPSFLSDVDILFALSILIWIINVEHVLTRTCWYWTPDFGTLGIRIKFISLREIQAGSQEVSSWRPPALFPDTQMCSLRWSEIKWLGQESLAQKLAHKSRLSNSSLQFYRFVNLRRALDACGGQCPSCNLIQSDCKPLSHARDQIKSEIPFSFRTSLRY